MIGFVIGTICFIGLVATLRRGRRWGRYGHGGFGPRRLLRRLFIRLDASPAQEKAIAEAAERARATGRELREDMTFLRDDLAEVLRKADVGHEDLEAVYTRYEAAMRTRARTVFDAVVSAHATLDATQREKLAALVTRSRGRGRDGGDGSPYRSISI